MYDVEILKQAQMLIPGGKKPLTNDVKSAISKSAREVLIDLAEGVNFDPVTVTKAQLCDFEISTDRMDEILGLQAIINKVEDASAKITPQVLAGQMDLVLQGLQHTADNLKEQPKQGECAVDDRSNLPNDYDRDLFDANLLREIVLDIPYPGQKISKAQKTQIQDSLHQTIANMIGNNNVDLKSLTPEFLQANLTLSDQKISEILELKSIHDSLTSTRKSTKGTDNQNISDRIHKVMSELRTNATEQKLASKVLEGGDSLHHEHHDANLLRNLMLDLPNQKSLNPDQKENLQKSLRNIISDLAHDETLHLSDINESSLRAKGISDKQISEIFQLKNLFKSLEGNANIDTKKIGQQLMEVEKNLRSDVATAETLRAFEGENDHFKKVHEANIAREIFLGLPGRGVPLGGEDVEGIKNNLTMIAVGITGKKNVDLGKISEKRMEKMGLSPEEIGEMLKLKNIYTELEQAPSEMDKKHLGEELLKLEQDIRTSAQVSRVEKCTQPLDLYDLHLQEADKLQSLILSIPAGPKGLKKTDRTEITASLTSHIQQ